MAENLNTNQNTKPAQALRQSSLRNNSGQAGQANLGANQPAGQAQGNSEPEFKELFKPFNSRLGLIAALVAIVAVAGLISLYLLGQSNKKQEDKAPSPTPVQAKSGSPDLVLPSLPPIRDEARQETLGQFFLKVSPDNFESRFLADIPDPAVNTYNTFADVNNDIEKRSAAASAFYLYIQLSAKDKSDPKFQAFLTDVKAGLENDLGRSL